MNKIVFRFASFILLAFNSLFIVIAHDFWEQNTYNHVQGANNSSVCRYIEKQSFQISEDHIVTIGITKAKDKNGKLNIHVEDMTLDEDNANYELFRMGEEPMFGIDDNISGYNKVTWNIFDDMGKKVRSVSFDQFVVYDEYSVIDPKFVKYIKELISKYDTNISKPNYVTKRYVLNSKGYITKSIYKSDKERLEAVVKAYKGDSPEGQIVELPSGKYTIRYYDRDNNKKTFEQVSIQKEGWPEFLVKEIIDNQTCINVRGQIINIKPMSQIVVKPMYVDAGSFIIEEEDLFVLLYKIGDFSGFNNAYDGEAKQFSVSPLKTGEPGKYSENNEK